MPLARSLFGRTALTIAASFLLLQAIVLAVIFNAVMRPMAENSANDLAALMVLVAQTWVELPPGTRADFKDELESNHQLWIDETLSPVDAQETRPPYAVLLERSLAQRTGNAIKVWSLEGDKVWLWTEIPIGAERIRIGFPRQRIGAQPLLALLAILGLGSLLILFTTLMLVRHLIRPIERLTQAVACVGTGNLPSPLPEEGSDELSVLARNFNLMAKRVRELLDDRTTILAGISHDLRTPLARLNLALEMLSERPRADLVGRMQKDLDEMNQLIGEFLSFSLSLQEQASQHIDVMAILSDSIEKAQRSGTSVDLECDSFFDAQGNPLALARILDNLIGNAVRHGKAGVRVECRRLPKANRICVLDRGPGIPPDQLDSVFRPFYRLDESRSSNTGGAGLGLAIARQLAQANGWQVELNNREGGGLEACLTLPDPI